MIDDEIPAAFKKEVAECLDREMQAYFDHAGCDATQAGLLEHMRAFCEANRLDAIIIGPNTTKSGGY
jgi:hypothetical protein